MSLSIEDKIEWNKMASDLEKFVTEGNKSVYFKLVRKVSDLEDESENCAFHPDYCHQIFSSGEMIFGYENLKIKLYYTAGSLKSYLNINYSRKINKEDCDGVEPDNLLEKIESVYQQNYLTNLDDFTKLIAKEAKSFKPFGEQVHSFTKDFTQRASSSKSMNGSGSTTNGNNGHGPTEKTFEIYSCDSSTPKFLEYYTRVETFLKWFIDAASNIDKDDERWKFFIIYEKYKTSEGETQYAFVGYSTVYEFYSFPDKIRPKLSQLMILPPFQKHGLGVELYNTICKIYRGTSNAIEITVEDPSDDFERLRDFADAVECEKLSSFSPDKLKKGFSPEMLEECKKTLKLTKLQSHRIYEMLRLRNTNMNNEKEMKEFRLDVKRRLNIPYEKTDKEIKRLKVKKVDDDALKAVAVDEKSRKTELESNFQNAYEHYKYIVKRLEKSAFF